MILLFLISVLAAAPDGGTATARSNLVHTTSASGTTETNTIVESAYTKLLAEDDAAQTEVDKWVKENAESKAKGAGLAEEELKRRIDERLEPIRRAYEQFVREHPDHAGARLAFGNFLNERQDEAGAQAQWEKALELDPKNPSIYNNLAGRYSESGPVKKAFEFFSKAIELNPREAAYYHNFADSLCVLSKPAMGYYGVSESEVYEKALQLYSNAARLEPRSFAFASDLALTHYSIKPLRTLEALKSWTNALQLAPAPLDREQVYLHLARIKMLAGQLAEARAQLEGVTNEQCAVLKSNLLRAIASRETPGKP